MLSEQEMVLAMMTAMGAEGEVLGRVSDRNLEPRWLWLRGEPLRFYQVKVRRSHSEVESKLRDEVGGAISSPAFGNYI